MSFYIRAGGAFLIALSALLLGRAYSGYVRARLDEEEGILALLIRIKEEISCYLTPQTKLAQGFESAALDRCGLLPRMREGVGLNEAFSISEGAMYSSVEIKAAMRRLCDGFGSAYREEELSRLGIAIDEVRRALFADKTEQEKNVKVARAIIAAVALGIIILLV